MRAGARGSALCLSIAVWATVAAFAGSALAAEPAKSAEPAKAAAKEVVWGKLSLADGSKTFELSGAEVLVGKDKSCKVQLDDRTVSGQHARITYRDGVVEVHDLGSAGGTLVAGAAVKPAKPFRIVQPVELTFGAVSLQFAFGQRPDFIDPTQKLRAPGSATKYLEAQPKRGAAKAKGAKSSPAKAAGEKTKKDK